VAQACRSQLRVAGLGGAYSLDYAAVLAMAAAMGACSDLLTDFLPDLEHVLVSALQADADPPDPDAD
jgi:hypothetical protein